jgi:hypothetical protein
MDFFIDVFIGLGVLDEDVDGMADAACAEKSRYIRIPLWL